MTLTAFAQRTMLPMRLTSVAASGLFIAYRLLGALYPVLALHSVLLLLNAKRLIDALRSQAQPFSLGKRDSSRA